jgi:acetolactate synthase-1/2/3 large subunit
MKYSDLFCDWLVEEGYTHCFFVAGGNIMHLLDSARTRFECVPFVHEVAAGIATEYFNECRTGTGGRAFVLVTAGPGLTNLVTAMAGAYLESRELLVIGGQVKSSDLSPEGLRQRGIQEIDGISLVKSICVATLRITSTLPKSEVLETIRLSGTQRPGPVFIEFTLDAQGAVPEERIASADNSDIAPINELALDPQEYKTAAQMLVDAKRPLILLGGGISRQSSGEIIDLAEEHAIPIATTWNAADRIDFSHPVNFGRPNTWGMRWSNILLQQCDLLIALGTRLGMQQTGFNWQEFVPLGSVIQVDIDPNELAKENPGVELLIQADGAEAGIRILQRFQPEAEINKQEREGWIEFGKRVEKLLPLSESENSTTEGYVNPFEFVERLSDLLSAQDVVIPCSSGGAFTVTMQAFKQKAGQVIVTDKGLASMGYGLSGALGAAIARQKSRVILIEGDGGFAQNLQELGTLRAQDLNLKLFLFCNEGYASIRMTQRNYFDGAYVGCDLQTGLGLPSWPELFSAYSIPSLEINPADPFNEEVLARIAKPGPCAFLVPIDPEQTYFPKISSHVLTDGSMMSNPLHLMTPELQPDLANVCMPYLNQGDL